MSSLVITSWFLFAALGAVAVAAVVFAAVAVSVAVAPGDAVSVVPAFDVVSVRAVVVVVILLANVFDDAVVDVAANVLNVACCSCCRS